MKMKQHKFNVHKEVEPLRKSKTLCRQAGAASYEFLRIVFRQGDDLIITNFFKYFSATYDTSKALQWDYFLSNSQNHWKHSFQIAWK